MRTLAHIAAIILLIPQVLAATAFAVLDHLTSGHTLGSFFENGFELLAVLFSWRGLVLLLAFVLLIVAGFSAKSRPWAAGIVVVIAIISAVVLVMHVGGPPSIEGWLFFVPGVIALALELWAIYAGRASMISSLAPR